MESLNEKVKFTVFARSPGTDRVLVAYSHSIEHGCNQFACAHPIAWSEGVDAGSLLGDQPLREELLAASTFAGRLIEKQADGSFIPRGVGGEALFRVGGIYRQQDGELVRLFNASFGAPDGTGWAKNLSGQGYGWRHLKDGRDTAEDEDWAVGRNLQTGELNEQGEPISCGSPIAATPPATEPVKSLGKLLREQMAAQAASEPCATRDQKGAERAAKWASQNKVNKAAEAAFQAAQDAKRSLGTARNPHPHWGAAVGLVK